MRPAETEFAPFFAVYVARVPEADPLPALEAQPGELVTLADRLTPEDELYRYAPDKWSVRQTFSHLIDTERIMGYRAFCIGRGDTTSLPGFDQDEYVARVSLEDRPVKTLAHEFAAVRHANLWTVRQWAEDEWSRIGTSNGRRLSARAIAYILVGHVRHHLAILREQYRLEI